MKHSLFALAVATLFLSACGLKANMAPSFENFRAADGIRFVTTPDCGQSCQERRQEFRYVVYVGKEIYCYWDEKKVETGTDFDALATTLEASITNATTASQYYRILRQWASSFHDGHVSLITKDDMTSLELYSTTLRLQTLAPGTPREKVVVSTPYGSLKAGSEILTVNGRPVKDALDDAEKAISGSTKAMRRYFATRRLVDVVGSDLGVQDLTITAMVDGNPITQSVPRMIQLDARPTPSVETETTGAELLKAIALPGGVGYLRIDGFAGSQDSFLLGQAMDRLQGTRGLILDLRKNGGGDLSGDAILARLIKSEIVRYKRSERMSPFILKERPESFFETWTPGALFADWHDLTVAPDAKSYAGPVVALTGPNCFSACDTFSSALKDNKLATFVGENTGGGTGTPLVFDLPASNLQFRYSVIRGQTPLGAAIEGLGTAPDVLAEATSSDVVGTTDTILTKGVDTLKGALPPELAMHIDTGRVTDGVRAQFKPIYRQDSDVAPSVADERALRDILAIDELR